MYFVICGEQIDISNVILWVNQLVRHCTKSAETSYLATVLALFTSSTNHSRSHKSPNIRLLTPLVAQDRNVDMQGGVTRVTLKFYRKFGKTFLSVHLILKIINIKSEEFSDSLD